MHANTLQRHTNFQRFIIVGHLFATVDFFVKKVCGRRQNVALYGQHLSESGMAKAVCSNHAGGHLSFAYKQR